MYVVGFNFVTHRLLLRFLSTTTRAFYDDYYNYILIFSLNAITTYQ